MNLGQKFALIFILCSFTYAAVIEDRSKAALSIFNIVKFENGPCTSSEMRNGTCYTEDECQERKGTASGSCAEGYGVCCVFSIRCGDTSSENCTYFQSMGSEDGACNAKICPLPGVCQLRLDFPKFDIAQPSLSAVATDLKTAFGVVDGGVDVTTMGQCLTDTFTVTAPGSTAPPVICGTNDGEHIYVDASEECNILGFQLSGSNKRSWEIKVTQLKCNFNNLAPSGCTQYFFDQTEGTIMSFNFNGGIHLAQQNQNICIRRELNHCQICYTHAKAQFDVSSAADTATADMGLVGISSKCCGYGSDGMKTTGYDCVIIPQASNGDKKIDLIGSEFCGRGLVAPTMTSMIGMLIKGPGTVCSKAVPFQIRFLSDEYEFGMEALKNPDGFKLTYKQVSCTT